MIFVEMILYQSMLAWRVNRRISLCYLISGSSDLKIFLIILVSIEPLLVLIEYVPYGDLLGYLRKSRGLSDTYFKDPDMKPQTNLKAEQLMKFAWQVADGMCYLSSKKVKRFKLGVLIFKKIQISTEIQLQMIVYGL